MTLEEQQNQALFEQSLKDVAIVADQAKKAAEEKEDADNKKAAAKKAAAKKAADDKADDKKSDKK